MLDNIKSTLQTLSKNNESNIELNTKFGILYKNQMINELENQSKQIQDLLKIKERHQKIIYVLQEEIKTHKKEKEKEEISLNKIKLKESGIRNLVKNLKEKVNNKKLEMIEIEHFRNFLLCVKYKVTKLKDLPQNIIEIYQLEKNKNKN